MSETSLCRERLKGFCEGDGLDLGFGGDPIVPTAITIDLPVPYTKVGDHPQNLHGDARNLHWFQNDCLDYIFSSHLFEDFRLDEMQSILFEWARVLKLGGRIILYLPDEQRYRAHCEKNNKPRNKNHKIENFGIDTIKEIIKVGSPNMRDRFYLKIIHENPECEDYSFEVVLEKVYH